jgi:hypothetical protein
MITLLTTLVILQAISHGLNTSGNKDAGHLLNALFVGLFLLLPFMFHLDWQQLPAYLAGYAGIRFLIYDYLWNLSAGKKWSYLGQSHWYGRFFRTWPSGLLLFAKIIVSIGLFLYYFRGI